MSVTCAAPAAVARAASPASPASTRRNIGRGTAGGNRLAKSSRSRRALTCNAAGVSRADGNESGGGEVTADEFAAACRAAAVALVTKHVNDGDRVGIGDGPVRLALDWLRGPYSRVSLDWLRGPYWLSSMPCPAVVNRRFWPYALLGLHSLPGGVTLVTWAVLAVIQFVF
jgi:hypothetical protein